MRNDLSRHAEPGTVFVTRLCDVETYATVHQLVSTIEATIAPGQSRAAVMAAAYLPGSMNGAPTISSMDILHEPESGPRGPYSGVVGYFSADGAADLSVTIRSAVFHNSPAGGQRLSVGIGGQSQRIRTPTMSWQRSRPRPRPSLVSWAPLSLNEPNPHGSRPENFTGRP